MKIKIFNDLKNRPVKVGDVMVNPSQVTTLEDETNPEHSIIDVTFNESDSSVNVDIKTDEKSDLDDPSATMIRLRNNLDKPVLIHPKTKSDTIISGMNKGGIQPHSECVIKYVKPLDDIMLKIWDHDHVYAVLVDSSQIDKQDRLLALLKRDWVVKAGKDPSPGSIAVVDVNENFVAFTTDPKVAELITTLPKLYSVLKELTDLKFNVKHTDPEAYKKRKPVIWEKAKELVELLETGKSEQ